MSQSIPIFSVKNLFNLIIFGLIPGIFPENFKNIAYIYREKRGRPDRNFADLHNISGGIIILVQWFSL